MMVERMEMLITLLGGISTLAVFSFLIKENAFYRLFEHIFIGISAGIGLVVSIKSFIWPKLFAPLLGLDIVTYPDGTFSKSYEPATLLYLIPMLFGTLFYFIYSKRHSWLAKLVIGFALGASGGAAFKGFFNEMMPQLFGTFKPLLVFSGHQIDWFESFSNCVFIFTLLSVMYYFFFSIRSESRTLGRVGVAGRWLMMVSFGAFFGSTIMARMALLVERLQFLLDDWSAAVAALFRIWL
ncbi:MAG: hypothetical protein K1X83_10325 [Oligoflexia bacterium]|nr:hypothetical protein [Oligoflexia bacterium]